VLKNGRERYRQAAGENGSGPAHIQVSPDFIGLCRIISLVRRAFKTRHLSGAAIEIGIAAGGTCIISNRFLRQIQSKREYIGVDTFGGFSEEVFAEDVKLGNDWKNFSRFSANSIDLVRKILRMHGAKDVKLLQGDISKIDRTRLPQSISACLLDVDLAVPIYDGLKLIWPLLETGGIVVVDDCFVDNQGDWQALKGFRKFCGEMGLEERFFCAAGYLVKGASPGDNIAFESAPVELIRA
jgi:predicted O-methyltransferase YrrM